MSETTFTELPYGTKVKLITKYDHVYIDHNTLRHPGELPEDHSLRLARHEGANKLYNAPLTVIEHKKVDLGDHKPEVYYFEELPLTPHLAHHFEIISKEVTVSDALEILKDVVDKEDIHETEAIPNSN